MKKLTWGVVSLALFFVGEGYARSPSNAADGGARDGVSVTETEGFQQRVKSSDDSVQGDESDSSSQSSSTKIHGRLPARLMSTPAFRNPANDQPGWYRNPAALPRPKVWNLSRPQDYSYFEEHKGEGLFNGLINGPTSPGFRRSPYDQGLNVAP